jgi:class 3 adenylate cyclase
MIPVNNRLLLRLLKKYLPMSESFNQLPPPIQAFVEACDIAFNDLMAHRARAEHSLSLVSSELLEKNELIESNKKSIETILLNILPQDISNRVLQGEASIADAIPEAHVLFADIVGFTALTDQMGTQTVVSFLNDVFCLFDDIALQYNVQKIKTIGDCYMVVSGIHNHRQGQLDQLIDMAQSIIQGFSKKILSYSIQSKLKVGIHSGPIIAGLIGKTVFNYDVWGNTVNIASRMESHGVGNAIHITEHTYHKLSPPYQTRFKKNKHLNLKEMPNLVSYLCLLDQDRSNHHDTH